MPVSDGLLLGLYVMPESQSHELLHESGRYLSDRGDGLS